jgi:hypothetical protein
MDPNQFGSAGGATWGSSGQIVVAGGQSPSTYTIGSSLATLFSGGASFFGAPPLFTLSGLAGLNGYTSGVIGVGGSGGTNTASQGTVRTGGTGDNGIVIVELYA